MFKGEVNFFTCYHRGVKFLILPYMQVYPNKSTSNHKPPNNINSKKDLAAENSVM